MHHHLLRFRMVHGHIWVLSKVLNKDNNDPNEVKLLLQGSKTFLKSETFMWLILFITIILKMQPIQIGVIECIWDHFVERLISFTYYDVLHFDLFQTVNESQELHSRSAKYLGVIKPLVKGYNPTKHGLKYMFLDWHIKIPRREK